MPDFAVNSGWPFVEETQKQTLFPDGLIENDVAAGSYLRQNAWQYAGFAASGSSLPVLAVVFEDSEYSPSILHDEEDIGLVVADVDDKVLEVEDDRLELVIEDWDEDDEEIVTDDETLVLVVEGWDEDEEPVMEEDELVLDIEDSDEDEDCMFVIDVVLV